MTKIIDKLKKQFKTDKQYLPDIGWIEEDTVECYDINEVDVKEWGLNCRSDMITLYNNVKFLQDKIIYNLPDYLKVNLDKMEISVPSLNHIKLLFYFNITNIMNKDIVFDISSDFKEACGLNKLPYHKLSEAKGELLLICSLEDYIY